MKWVIELSHYNIDYKPRTTIKSQALAEFIADFIERTSEVLNIKKNH